MELTKENLDKAVRMIIDNGATLLNEIVEKSLPEPPAPGEVKKQIGSLLDISREQQRIYAAFDSINDYLQRCSYPAEIEEINENWVQAFEKFGNMLNKTKEANSKNPEESFQAMIGLSPKTYEIFYAAGKELYDQNAFEQAADIFFVLTLFNHSYPSVWLSFGLSEQKCGRFEAALRAFAMGAVTDNKSPEPLLCAADCCIAMNDPDEAKIYLEEATARIDRDSQYESFRSVAKKIGKLLSNI